MRKLTKKKTGDYFSLNLPVPTYRIVKDYCDSKFLLIGKWAGQVLLERIEAETKKDN